MTPEQENELNAQIAKWEKVTREKDGDEAYIKAQLNIAIIYSKNKLFNKSIQICENSIELFPNERDTFIAKIILAQNYMQLQKYDKAIELYQELTESVDKKYKYKMYNSLGLAYKTYGLYDEAIGAYKLINESANDDTTYNISRVNLSVLYDEIGESEQSVKLLKAILYDSSQFATAQLKLGTYYVNIEDFNQAIEAWEKVDNKDENKYLRAQFYLGCIYAKKGQQEKTTECFNKFRDIANKEDWGFIFECIDKNTLNDKNIFYIIYLSILLLETLQLEMIHYSERKLAHYTSTYVVNELLDKDSPIRLNHIGNMNDPTEGGILFNYLHDSLNYNRENSSIDKSAFISCFTLNHDSLNQFRLYGKTAQKDATGVSLVVDKEFFKQPNFLELSLPVKGMLDDARNNDEQEVNQEKEHLQAVYRCIYIDPETGYIRLAQRDKMTFYREFFKDNKSENEIEILWNNYQKYIQTKEGKVKDILKKMKRHIQCILNEANNKSKEEMLELIQFILLPLQYLVKHSAFQEEQECRMCYITSLNSKNVDMDFNKKMFYINYPEPVKPHIKNVYIATGAKEYYPFIVRLLGENSVSKVQLSKNPFRVMG